MSEKFPLALAEGTVLAGQYIIEKALGQGGFGITYKAKDYKSGQSVAVKEFFPEALATRTNTTVVPFTGERGESYAYGKNCFLQEAETLAQFIGIENIVRIHSYFEENGTAYFVMDFIEGVSFDEYIKSKGGKISYEEAEKVLIKIIEALAIVHSKGIVHRDVTPDNIYITNDGVVKLLDFGAARYSIGDKSRSLDVVLKHGFAPKEQYTRHGKQGPFTDVYTVGASFYFAITGKRPPDSIDRIEEDDLVPPSRLGVQIPAAKENAILKAMSVQPADRYQTMNEFKAALMSTNVSSAQAGQPMAQQPAQPIAQQSAQPMAQQPVQPMAQQPAQPMAQQAGQPMANAMPGNGFSNGMQNNTPQMMYQNQMQQAMPQNRYQQAAPNYAVPGNTPVYANVKQTAKKKWVVPTCIGAAVVAIVAIVGIVLLQKKDEKDSSYSASSESYNDYSYNDTNIETDTNDNSNNAPTNPTEADATSYDAGTFNQLDVNNNTNGGCHLSRDAEMWYYYPNEGLLHDMDYTNTCDYLDSGDGNYIGNINLVSNVLIYTKGLQACMITDGNCYAIEELIGYEVTGIWANEIGAFFSAREDDYSYNLYYINWQEGLRPYHFAIKDRSCVTILGDNIYVVTADGSEVVRCSTDTALTESDNWLTVTAAEGFDFSKMVSEGSYLYAAARKDGCYYIVRINIYNNVLEYVSLENNAYSIDAINVYDGVIYYAAADWTNYSTNIWNMKILDDGTIPQNDLLATADGNKSMAVYDLCVNPHFGYLWMMGITPDGNTASTYIDINGSELYDYAVVR